MNKKFKDQYNIALLNANEYISKFKEKNKHGQDNSTSYKHGQDNSTSYENVFIVDNICQTNAGNMLPATSDAKSTSDRKEDKRTETDED